MKQPKFSDFLEVKACALDLFDAVEIKPHSAFGFMVQHPYTNSIIVQVLPNTKGLEEYEARLKKDLELANDMSSKFMNCESKIEFLLQRLNLLKTNTIDLSILEGQAVFKNHIFNLIKEAKEISDILMLVNSAWYMSFLKFTSWCLTEEDLGKVLGMTWIMQEFPNRDKIVTRREIIKWFREASKKTLMDPEEYQKYEELRKGKTLTVYRGVGYDGKPSGLSWTLSLEKAIWFANRFNPDNAKVYKMDIDLTKHKNNILAYFDGRNEQEVIVDVYKCNDWMEVEV